MATSTSFDAVLKRYMPYEMLVEEMKKRSYFWDKVKKKSGWKGGTLEYTFEGGEASSLSFGALTSATDVAEGTYVAGTISSQPELWGTMKFNEKDLDRHGDLTKSYLQIAPQKINQFVNRMSERVDLALIGDGSVAIATGNGHATLGIAVDHPERFTIGEKVVVDDNNSSPVSGYVRTIDINTGIIVVYDARTGGSVVDLSGYATANAAKVHHVGQQASGFTSLQSALLSETNGGSASIAGQTKTAYPFLQALNISGSAWDKDTINSDVFGAFFAAQELGKGRPTEMLVPFQVAKYMSIANEAKKQFVTKDKRSGYGWVSWDLIGPEGDITLTALRNMPNSKAIILDWDAVEFHGDKFFDRKRFDGREYFAVRETTGYSYLVDVKFYGDLVVKAPSHCAIVHSIPTLSAT